MTSNSRRRGRQVVVVLAVGVFLDIYYACECTVTYWQQG